MKIAVQKDGKTFRKLTLSITIESEAELAGMMAALNQSTAQIGEEYQRAFTDRFPGITKDAVMGAIDKPMYSMWAACSDHLKDIRRG